MFSKKATAFRPIPQPLSRNALPKEVLDWNLELRKISTYKFAYTRLFFLLPFILNQILFEGLLNQDLLSVHNIKHFPKFLYHQDLRICFVKRNLRYVKPCSKVNLRSLASIKCNCGRMLGRYKTTSKP